MESFRGLQARFVARGGEVAVGFPPKPAAGAPWARVVAQLSSSHISFITSAFFFFPSGLPGYRECKSMSVSYADL